MERRIDANPCCRNDSCSGDRARARRGGAGITAYSMQRRIKGDIEGTGACRIASKNVKK